jgi:HEAT repeat protein
LRYVAVNALGSAAMESEQAMFALEKSLTDSETNVAAAAGLNLSRIDSLARRFDVAGAVVDSAGSPTADLAHWIANLSHSSAAVRQTAAIRLAMAGPSASRAVAMLRDHLRDRDLVVRVHVARALWIIAPSVDDVLPVLVDLLDIEKPNVSVAAAYVLGRMGPEASAALPSLHNMLSNSDLLDRLVVAATISRIGAHERGALAILVGGLRDPEADVRYLSAIALGDAPLSHHRRLERELTSALRDRNLRVQSAADESLARIRERLGNAGGMEQSARRGEPGSAHGDAEPPLDTIPPIMDAELAQVASDPKD